jgi:hypothetical protein
LQTYSKEQAREQISRLVESFRKVEANLDEAQESQIENDYIRPFFRCLNWATEGSGLRKSEREMVLVETDRQGKRPDYRFQLNGQHLFFVDAKKVKYRMHDPRWQWQVYRYAYSTRHNPAPRKVDFGVLTDFQEFILLDCTFEAKEPEAVNNFRVVDWRYPDYLAQFDRLWELFERNNMLEASRDRKSGLWACYLTSKQAKANRVPPDEGFLDKLDNDKNGWRVRLAKDMKKCSSDLTGEVITGAVQLLIDRLVFIKALSDRDIDDDYLAKLAECIEANGLDQSSRGWFAAAKPLFDRLNRFYNGSMFAPRPELETVLTSNRVVRDIIRELDPNHSPYDFSVLPVEILGTIYERFLGKVVRTTEQRVKIEDKPEVRKAGGVYYTPQYIVRYIVEQTIGKLLADCKTPDDVARLKILDPACGSGSFLIGAYDALIEWHKSYYAAKAKPDRKAAYRDADGDIRLAAKLKRKILLNNIFGVDIDQQAVEVTRFSLSLKALEDTRKDELDEERNLFKETVLPDLKDNIVCGNSLIGTDILEGQLFAPEEERKLNPMNYGDKFPEIMGRGGFDAVIGNPPWGSYFSGCEKSYLITHYANRRGEAESHLFFMERAIQLLNESGIMGYITPNTWLSVLNSREIRQFLLKTTRFQEVTELSKCIFSGAPDIVPVLVFLGKESKPQSAECVVRRSTAAKVDATNFDRVLATKRVPQTVWSRNLDATINLRATPDVILLTRKCSEAGVPLGKIYDVLYGIKTGDNAAFLSDKPTRRHKRKALKTGEIVRYGLTWKHVYLWWCKALAGYRESSVEVPKIVVQYIRKISMPRRLIAALDEKGEYYPLNNYSYICQRERDYGLNYVLGVFNSSLLNFYFANTFIDYNIKPTYLQQLPIHRIDFSNAAEKSRHDKIASLVEQMMAAKQAWAAAQTEKDKTYYEDKCKALDKQIDALVYELYDLTAKEIAIVEAK